jgi:putative tryptophan/tyrosine transport system substrate-binding protein
MKRREFITLVGGAAVATPFVARAQQPKKVPRIGVLWQGANAETHPYFKPLRDGFKDVGYVDGDLIFEDRFFDKNFEKVSLDVLAKQLVDLKCDVLIGVAAVSALALRRATSTIPIVFVFNARPVASGLVSSLNHPGGNVTGVTHVTADLSSKRVELLRDTIPGLSSVALIWDPNPAIQYINLAELEDTRTGTNRLGLSFEAFECGSPEVVEQAILKASRFGAAIVGNSAWYIFERKRFAEQAALRRLAVMGDSDGYSNAGFLMSYGTNWTTLVRSAAPLVKKILEGEKPENIPVQQPTTFDLVFNLKTAQAIGLQIPPIMIARATRVI